MTTPGNDHFDETMRRLHMQAASHVTAGTMAELHRRRHAALAGAPASKRLFGWPLAAAFTTVVAVAIALGIGLQDPVDDTRPDATPQVATLDTTTDEFDDTLAPLDENPDFFVWLASSDATLLAME